nr:PREDICTED: protein phosphatase 1K, mitochondrial-like isoform X1 [Paralichthys olivaceus]
MHLVLFLSFPSAVEDMSSTVLLNLLRCARCTGRTFLQSSAQTSPASGQVGGALLGVVGVRRASGSVCLNVDDRGRPVTWDSFGIWDNRIEEPVLLPSSIRYGKPIPQVSLSRVGSASVLGLRKQNEDRLRVARIHDNLLYFAVFDGHGGPHAADYCYTFMEKFIRDALEDEDDLEKVLKKAFLDADSALHTHLSYFNNASFLTAGTTATVALLRDGVELVVGSVGDSRAMLCRKGRATKLTKDHTPDCKDERHRIQRFGGFVTWNSVGQANVNGRLAMTRSIGDFHLKNSGVIAEPDTRRQTVRRKSDIYLTTEIWVLFFIVGGNLRSSWSLQVQHANDSFLALTTDGINFLLSDQEVCDVINQCQDPTEAADVIAQQALQYGSEDNGTIIIVPLAAWGKHQSSTIVYSMSRNFASSGRWA